MNMSGKTVLITGSTDGVGRRVAERLAAAGATVLVHGRDKARAGELVSRIRDRGGKATFYLADLSSLDEVRTLADAVECDHDRLDLLVNNAGIGTGGDTGRQQSRDGHELRFAVNYLAGSGVTANCLHPASYMDTTMVRQAGVTPMSSVEQGAEAILNLAAGTALEGHTGLYYDGLRPSRASAQAYEAAARQRLQTLSEALTGLA